MMILEAQMKTLSYRNTEVETALKAATVRLREKIDEVIVFHL
jgi:hypothetical protein